MLLAMFVSAMVTSCYKIFKTHAPKEVTAGQKFDVKMVVVDNGDAYQKEMTDWSVAAIRVPEDWDVKCGAQDYRCNCNISQPVEQVKKVDPKRKLIMLRQFFTDIGVDHRRARLLLCCGCIFGELAILRGCGGGSGNGSRRYLRRQ